jgi:L-rhamnose-H+ transport protein
MLEGVGLTVVAGAMAGNCMLPMKFAQRWSWEHVWLIFSIVSLLVLPWTLALVLVQRLLEVYRTVPAGVMLLPLLLGAGWGVAQILFGISVRRLGVGLAYAIVIGLGAALGTLVPLLLGQRHLVATEALVLILAGVLVMVAGIALTAWGGRIRERAEGAALAVVQGQSGYGAALALAVLCGLMAPMLNYAFAFGQGLATEAVALGNTSLAAGYAVWPIALLGGLVPNLAYSVYLLQKRRSWAVYRGTVSEVGWPALMAVLWMGSMAVYGMSAVYLGEFGTSIGWGLFQIFMILTATISGLLTAEWKHAPRMAMSLLGAGMTGLVGATVLLSLGGR